MATPCTHRCIETTAALRGLDGWADGCELHVSPPTGRGCSQERSWVLELKELGPGVTRPDFRGQVAFQSSLILVTDGLGCFAQAPGPLCTCFFVCDMAGIPWGSESPGELGIRNTGSVRAP